LREEDELEFLYSDQYLDLKDVYSEMGNLIWEDLKWWNSKGEHIIPAFKITDITSLAELDYFQKHWPAHKRKMEEWLDWFQDHISRIVNIDSDDIREHEKERWDDDEIDKDDYEDFDEYWEEYEGSDSYYDEVHFLQEMYWDDIKNDFGYVFEVINNAIDDEWFDNYDNIQTWKMDKELESVFEEIDEKYQEFIKSAFDEDDAEDKEWLKDHFDDLFR
jgi:hypothetical protein